MLPFDSASFAKDCPGSARVCALSATSVIVAPTPNP
jgi:hypothetical protein